MIRIVSDYFVAGLVLDRNYLTVIRAAPILSYMMGWSVIKVIQYCDLKNWEYETL